MLYSWQEFLMIFLFHFNSESIRAIIFLIFYCECAKYSAHHHNTEISRWLFPSNKQKRKQMRRKYERENNHISSSHYIIICLSKLWSSFVVSFSVLLNFTRITREKRERESDAWKVAYVKIIMKIKLYQYFLNHWDAFNLTSSTNTYKVCVFMLIIYYISWKDVPIENGWLQN